MFKDVFQLKKDSWHMRMMNYVWEYTYRDFSHICPYFWLSIFNLFAIIPVWTWKGLLGGTGKLIGKGFDKLGDFINKSSEKSRMRYMEYLKKNPKARINFLNRYTDYSSRHRFIMKLDDPDLRAELFSFVDLDKEKREKRERMEREITMKNKEKINLFIKKAKPVAQFILYILALLTIVGVLLLLYYGVIWLYDVKFTIYINFTKILRVLKDIGWGIIRGLVCLLAAIVVIFILIGFFKNTTLGKMTESFFKWFGMGIVKIFSIIFQMLKNNCPSISWEN